MCKFLRRLNRVLTACKEVWTQSAIDGDDYEAPPHGWTCFHCGETYFSSSAARHHFGERPTSIAECKVGEDDYRSMEMRLAATLEQNRRLITVNRELGRNAKMHMPIS